MSEGWKEANCTKWVTLLKTLLLSKLCSFLLNQFDCEEFPITFINIYSDIQLAKLKKVKIACKIKSVETILIFRQKKRGKGGGGGGVMDNWEEKVIYILAGVGFWQNVLHKFLYRFFLLSFYGMYVSIKAWIYTWIYTHIHDSYWSGPVRHNCPYWRTDRQNTQTDTHAYWHTDRCRLTDRCMLTHRQMQADTQTDKGNTCHNQWIYWKRNGRHDNYAGWMCHLHHKWDACLWSKRICHFTIWEEEHTEKKNP